MKRFKLTMRGVKIRYIDLQYFHTKCSLTIFVVSNKLQIFLGARNCRHIANLPWCSELRARRLTSRIQVH